MVSSNLEVGTVIYTWSGRMELSRLLVGIIRFADAGAGVLV